ncbi:MAG: hypothetical protein IJR65_00460 [Oscillospiraceae bacterium]|nr:hypothetical protein [Oscillospiraceae bacterium]
MDEFLFIADLNRDGKLDGFELGLAFQMMEDEDRELERKLRGDVWESWDDGDEEYDDDDE